MFNTLGIHGGAPKVHTFHETLDYVANFLQQLDSGDEDGYTSKGKL